MRWNDASMLKRQQKCDCRMECVGAQAKAQCMDASLWSNLEESFQLFLIFFLDFEENFCVLSSSIINDFLFVPDPFLGSTSLLFQPRSSPRS